MPRFTLTLLVKYISVLPLGFVCIQQTKSFFRFFVIAHKQKGDPYGLSAKGDKALITDRENPVFSVCNDVIEYQ